MNRHMSDYEERRLDQLAFAAEKAEYDFKTRPKGLPVAVREALRTRMEVTQKQLATFVGCIVNGVKS